MIKLMQARLDQSDEVAQLVHELLFELFPDLASTYPLPKLQKAAFQLLRPGGGVWSFLAFDNNNVAVGMINLNRCAAIYAGGEFGEITEMYVRPEYRSQKVGEQLIACAKDFAKAMAWSVLEVGAPDVPRCQRTVDFYQRNGFATIGPRLELAIII